MANDPVRPPATLVLGLGNPLMADDGIGLALAERLTARWDLPAGVQVEDGGTWGMLLLPGLEDADAVILLDAIDLKTEPGSTVVLEREEVPRRFALLTSPHQVSISEVLAAAEFRGRLPACLVAIGIQPARVELDTNLSQPVADALDRTADAVAELLQEWGHDCRRKLVPACMN